MSSNIRIYIRERNWVSVLFLANSLQHHVALFVHNRFHAGEKLYKPLV